MKQNMVHKFGIAENGGSAVVIAMLTLLVVTIIGVGTLNNSITERTIATNEMLYQQAFYEADGGTTMAEKLIEQNIITFDGFDQEYISENINSNQDAIEKLKFDDKYTSYPFRFWTNDEIQGNPWCYPGESQDDRDFYIETQNGPTNIKVGYVPKFSTGSAIQMAAGYEGKGKSLSQSGHYLMYGIYAQNDRQPRDVKATLHVNWRFVD